jgi:polysaccharide chain length determinant protein (PEP-CTERM system associated)
LTPALNEFFDTLRGAWRYRWLGMAAAFVVALVGWTVVFALPDRYGAEAEVFVDTLTALTELKPTLQGLTNDQTVDAQINFVHQSLLEGPQLEQIAERSGVLPASVTDPGDRTEVLKRLSKQIVLTVTSAGSKETDPRARVGTIYGFEYSDASRERAYLVVKTLLETFVEKTLGGKRQGSEEAQKFLGVQIKDYAQRLSAAEDKLATFKKKNIGLMPSEQGGYFTQLSNETDAEKKAEIELSIAMSRREELAKQLHGDEAVSAAGSAAAVVAGGRASPGDTMSRIQETQAKLDELLLKYTDQHPDVIAARADLAELKKRRAAELEALRHGDAAAIAASGAGNNPVYQSMQLELNKVDVEIAALRRGVAQHESTVADLRQRLNTAPQVEAEYQQLNRDYDVNKAQYTALLESYQKASLGESADNAGSVRFDVVLPPAAPIVPTWPARTLLLAGIWLAAIAVGVGLAYGLHTLKPVVSSVRSVNQLTSFPVLGLVSAAFPTRHHAETRYDAVRFAAASLCLVVALVGVLALSWSGARLNSQTVNSLVKT